MIAESLSSRNTVPPLFDGIEITSDTLTGRGGLALFSRSVRNLEIFPHLDRLFGSMRKSSKGLPVTTLLWIGVSKALVQVQLPSLSEPRHHTAALRVHVWLDMAR